VHLPEAGISGDLGVGLRVPLRLVGLFGGGVGVVVVGFGSVKRGLSGAKDIVDAPEFQVPPDIHPN